MVASLKKGPNRVGVPPFTWGWKQIQFPKCVLQNTGWQKREREKNPSVILQKLDVSLNISKINYQENKKMNLIMKESSCGGTILFTELVFKISNKLLLTADAEDNEPSEPHMDCDNNFWIWNTIHTIQANTIILHCLQLQCEAHMLHEWNSVSISPGFIIILSLQRSQNNKAE